MSLRFLFLTIETQFWDPKFTTGGPSVMAIVEPKDKTVAAYKGLHLYHGDISNCSMRVDDPYRERSRLEKSSH